MSDSQACDTTIAAFTRNYQRHLADVDGMAPNSCDLHLRLVCRLLTFRFPSGEIRWPQLAFSHVADFLTREFARLPSYATQQTWLMIVRKLLRHLESNGLINKGWEGALPKRAIKKHSALPRYLSPDETRALWNACRKERSHRHARDRALLSVFTQLALRAGEVARITLADIDWQQGTVLIRSTKTHRERVLPLPQEVGEAVVEHIRIRPQNSPQVFGPRRPPFTAKRCRWHIGNCMTSLFRRAGLSHSRMHSLRHTAATGMVNAGASFKEIADVLGHKGLDSTLLYAKLDMKALGKVCMPWPGGAR